MNIETIHAKLLGMLKKCHEDIAYACGSASWPRKTNDSKTMEEAVEAEMTGASEDILRLQKLRLHKGKTITRVGTWKVEAA